MGKQSVQDPELSDGVSLYVDSYPSWVKVSIVNIVTLRIYPIRYGKQDRVELPPVQSLFRQRWQGDASKQEEQHGYCRASSDHLSPIPQPAAFKVSLE